MPSSLATPRPHSSYEGKVEGISGAGKGSAYIVAPQPALVANGADGLSWCNGSLAFDSGTASVEVAWSLTGAWGEHEQEQQEHKRGGTAVDEGSFVLTVDSTGHPAAAVGRIGLPLHNIQISNPEEADVTFIQTTSAAATAATTAEPPDGLVVSDWGFRDGRLWYDLTTPQRLTIVVKRR